MSRAVLSPSQRELSLEDSPSYPFVSGGHGDTVGVVSNTLEKGGQEGLSQTAPKELVADGDGDGHHENSLLDTYVVSARKPTSDRGGGENLDKSRRVRRFYQRFFTGVGVGGRLRFLTLTSSDSAVANGYDIHRHFRALVMRLRRSQGSFEYMGVKEFKGDRKHLHIVFRGSYVEQAHLSHLWGLLHDSPVVDIRLVRKVRGGVRYMAKYLAKETANRYWQSYGWIFRGWVGWSKLIKGVTGRYPSKSILCGLARIANKVDRLCAMLFFESQLAVISGGAIRGSPTFWALQRALP